MPLHLCGERVLGVGELVSAGATEVKPLGELAVEHCLHGLGKLRDELRRVRAFRDSVHCAAVRSDYRLHVVRVARAPFYLERRYPRRHQLVYERERA